MRIAQRAAAVAVTFLLAGCGTTASPAVSPSASSPGSSSPTPTVEGSATPEVTPSPAAVETPSPAVIPSLEPVPMAGGTWVSPKSGSSITTYTAALSAKLTVPPGAAAVAKVVFSVAWPGGRKTACSATKAGTGGAWSCKADLLKLGVPPGKLTLAFDVHDAAGDVALRAGGDRTATYAVAPPRPTNPTWTEVSRTTAVDLSETIVERLTWKAPAGYATEFRLYGVTRCLNESAKTNGQPCLVEHMALPSADLDLLKTVAGSERSLLLKLTIPGEVCPGTIWCGDLYGIVLGASNRYGRSVFTITTTSEVCWECTW